MLKVEMAEGGHELWASINQVGNALQQTKLARAGGSSGEASLLDAAG